MKAMWPCWGLNSQPLDLESDLLSTELLDLDKMDKNKDEYDPLLLKF